MINIETYIVEGEKEGKKLVELTCEDYRNLVLLKSNELNFLNFLREEGYLHYDCSFNIVEKIDIKEF